MASLLGHCKQSYIMNIICGQTILKHSKNFCVSCLDVLHLFLLLKWYCIRWLGRSECELLYIYANDLFRFGLCASTLYFFSICICIIIFFCYLFYFCLLALEFIAFILFAFGTLNNTFLFALWITVVSEPFFNTKLLFHILPCLANIFYSLKKTFRLRTTFSFSPHELSAKNFSFFKFSQT